MVFTHSPSILHVLSLLQPPSLLVYIISYFTPLGFLNLSLFFLFLLSLFSHISHISFLLPSSNPIFLFFQLYPLNHNLFTFNSTFKFINPTSFFLIPSSSTLQLLQFPLLSSHQTTSHFLPILPPFFFIDPINTSSQALSPCHFSHGLPLQSFQPFFMSSISLSQLPLSYHFTIFTLTFGCSLLTFILTFAYSSTIPIPLYPHHHPCPKI
jgi:hypothetical protein